MKTSKWFLLLLAVCLVFSFAACGGGGGGSDDPAGGGNGGGNSAPAGPWICFTATGSSSVEMAIMGNLDPIPSLEYSKDGSVWIDFVIGATKVELADGERVYLRAKSTNDSFSKGYYSYVKFVMEGSIAASGNLMSLLDKTCTSTEIPCEYCFAFLFKGCSALTSAPLLPAVTLTSYCYYVMFSGCSSLTTAPDLPATTLAYWCYNMMFSSCSSLTTAPDLPAMTLTDHCYSYMFLNCFSLTTAPDLPAMTLEKDCYDGMFAGCSSLTTAPDLPAMTLTNYCYAYMFYGCSALTTAPALPATTLANYCYNYMFKGCSDLSSITVHFTSWDGATKATQSWVDGVGNTGIREFHCRTGLNTTSPGVNKNPSGWTVIKDVPEPAP